MVQSPLQPQILCTKFEMQLGAVAACAPPPGGTARRSACRVIVGDGGKGRAVADRHHLEAGGHAPRRGRHGSSTPGRSSPGSQTPSKSGEVPCICDDRRGRTRGGPSPRPRRPIARTWSARHSRCRTPAASIPRRYCGARGPSAVVTECGEPERMMPFGSNSLMRCGIGVERKDLAIDPGLAHAPRDQLRHLRAEIENKNAVGHSVSWLLVAGAIARAVRMCKRFWRTSYGFRSRSTGSALEQCRQQPQLGVPRRRSIAWSSSTISVDQGQPPHLGSSTMRSHAIASRAVKHQAHLARAPARRGSRRSLRTSRPSAEQHTEWRRRRARPPCPDSRRSPRHKIATRQTSEYNRGRGIVQPRLGKAEGGRRSSRPRRLADAMPETRDDRQQRRVQAATFPRHCSI